MINSVKARTPILALILFVFAVGYTFAANKVVVIPLGGPDAEIHLWDEYLPTLSATSTANNHSVESTRSGRWLITTSLGSYTLRCTGSVAGYFYILVDRVPIRSSVRYSVTGEMVSPVFTGITENVIPAGIHNVGMGGQCYAGTNTGSSATLVSGSSVIVMP
jgi:hypothetical protein